MREWGWLKDLAKYLETTNKSEKGGKWWGGKHEITPAYVFSQIKQFSKEWDKKYPMARDITAQLLRNNVHRSFKEFMHNVDRKCERVLFEKRDRLPLLIGRSDDDSLAAAILEWRMRNQV